MTQEGSVIDLQIAPEWGMIPHMTHQETITTYEYTYTCVFDPEPEGGFTGHCCINGGRIESCSLRSGD